ncbi:MAG: site-specific integrase [Lachnospiraceae bacterium]|jgi:integrase|nr:site-specific integrase [Lachnospiraceae bacterium]
MEKKERTQKNKEKGNGEGTLYKSSVTGLYIGQYFHEGRRKSLYQKKNEKITDFKGRFNKVMTEVNEHTYISNSSISCISIAEEYIKQKYSSNITSPRSYKRNQDTVNELKKTCDNFIYKSVQKVTVNDIEKAKDKIKVYSNNVITKIWSMLDKIFKIAISRRIIAFNPLDDELLVKPISNKQMAKVEALTEEEQKHLEEVLKDSEHLYNKVCLLQLYTGARIGEVLALSRDCVDLKNNTLTIYRTLTRDENDKVILGKHTKTYNKKTNIDNGKRTFYMIDKVKEIILELLECKVANIHNLLFWDYFKNTFITDGKVNSYLDRLNEKYNITDSLHTHRLRHTFITRCQEQGVPLPVLQYLVGHIEGSKITTDVYTSVSLDFVKSALDKLA